MSGKFRVELTVGSYSWTATETTKPASPGVLDGLRFGWRIPEGDYSTAMQPEPMTASFGLVADDVATYADLAKGQNVGIKVWTHGRSGGTPEYSFYGRVSDLEAEPIKGGRIVYSLTAVDYNGDLGDATVGTSNWSNPTRYGDVEPLQTRLDRIFDEAGHTAIYGPAFGEPLDPLTADFGPRSASPVKALDIIRDYLRQTITTWANQVVGAADTHQNTVRIVTPYADKDGYISRWSPGFPDFGIDYFPLTTAWTATLGPPFTVTRPAATVTVTSADPRPAQSIVDACRVELGAKWRKDKASGINRVNIDADSNGVTRRVSTSTQVAGDGYRELTVPDQGRGDDGWAVTAGYLDADTTWYPTVITPVQFTDYFYRARGDALPNNWTFDKLTWHLTADESAATAVPRRLMPQHDATSAPTNLARWAWAAVPIVVLGIPREQNLPGDTVTYKGAATGYTVGVPTGVELRFERGHVLLDVVLARRLPRTPTTFLVAETNRLFQWDDFDPAPFTGATWNNVNDIDTWLNYRLSRRP